MSASRASRCLTMASRMAVATACSHASLSATTTDHSAGAKAAGSLLGAHGGDQSLGWGHATSIPTLPRTEKVSEPVAFWPTDSDSPGSDGMPRKMRRSPLLRVMRTTT